MIFAAFCPVAWCFPGEGFIIELGSSQGKFSVQQFFEVKEVMGDDWMIEDYESICSEFSTAAQCIREAQFNVVIIRQVAFCIGIFQPLSLSCCVTKPETEGEHFGGAD